MHPAEDAIRSFWEAHGDRLSTRGVGGVRIGRSTQAIVDAIVEELVLCGLDRASIRRDQPLPLPGSYHESHRPWDLVVIDEGVPVAAVEVTINTGSFTNNLRNRMDDILAQTTNVSRGYDQQSVQALKPALGQVFLLEECAATTTPPRQRPNPLDASESAGPPKSHEGRLLDFLQRLVRDGMYDAICYLVSHAPPTVTVREPDPGMGFATFAQTLVDRITKVREARRQRNLSAAELGRLLAERNVSPTELGRTIAGLADVGGVVSGITSTDEGRLAVDVDVIRRRREAVAELRELVLNPATTEAEIQKMIGRRYWIFGGHYTGVLDRRNAVPLDQHDIPLVCADRSIHIVELKRPGHQLVKPHRNHLIVSNEVHEAVGQCMNYIRALDELGAGLETLHRNELGVVYDYRRVKGTVVIGHPELCATDSVAGEQIEQTIRSYNAHLSRVQVLTYAELVDSAERALQFEAEEH
nr:Shedu anti-phage system protein SduA domain-containing protein [Kibdelosporangium phytohabitans]